MSTSTTRRALGLSVTFGYAVIGIIAVVAPGYAGDTLLGLKPSISPVHDKPLLIAVRLIGVRDISVAAALYVFNRYDNTRAMGQLILCGLMLQAADVYTALIGHYPTSGVLIGLGTALTAAIGYGLAKGLQYQ